MRMYGGDWLTNAALVGYIRIQKKNGITPKIKDGYVEITKKDLESFADRYFNTVLEQYMQNSFVINQDIQKKILGYLGTDEQKKTFRQKRDEFSKKYQEIGKIDPSSFKKSSDAQVHLLKRFQKDFKKFLSDMEIEFEITKGVFTSLFKNTTKNDNSQNDTNNKDKNQKIEEKIKAISTEYYKFIPNSLSRFYFNKRIVGNYSITKKSSRLDAFDESFVKPAIALLESKQSNGHITCKLCKQNKVTLTAFDEDSFSEDTFSTTMVSKKKFKNFFYNGQSDLFICKVCELLLVCTWAGFNPIPLNARDDIIQTDQIFVNTSDLETTLKQNDEIVKHNLKNDLSFKETIYRSVFTNILLQQQKLKSKWVMDSCFFVELKTVSRKDSGKPDFRYFHIGKNIAELFGISYVVSALERLHKSTLTIKKETKIRLINWVIERLLSSKPLIDLCYIICKDEQNYKSEKIFNVCVISAIRSVTNSKFGSGSMISGTSLDSKQVYGILKGLQTDGRSLSAKIDGGKGNSNKSKSLSYVLLEAIRNNNMNKFFDVITKLYMTNNMAVPDTMISMLNRQDSITISEKAYAFMSGFCSNIKEDASNE